MSDHGHDHAIPTGGDHGKRLAMVLGSPAPSSYLGVERLVRARDVRLAAADGY